MKKNAMVALLLASASACSWAADRIKVGMTLPSSSLAFGARAAQVEAGVKAYLNRINSTGGVNGRTIEVVALNDDGLPDKVRQNTRQLLNQHKVSALLNCVGDGPCRIMAEEAAAAQVPLVGALSGTEDLMRTRNPYVFRVRAMQAREADALAAQLKAMGSFNVAVLNDPAAGSSFADLATASMGQVGLKVTQIKYDASSQQRMEEAIKELGRGAFQAVVLALPLGAVSNLIEKGIDQRPEIPRVVVFPSDGTLTVAMTSFPGRTLGFSSVVPNPDLTSPLARQLDADATRYSTAYALTFDGMEAYIGARLLVEGLKRFPSANDAKSLQAALNGMDKVNINGLSLSFAKGAATGSTEVGVGVRSRHGILLK